MESVSNGGYLGGEVAEHKLGAADTDLVIRSYAEIELPESLRDNLALFMRLERQVLRRTTVRSFATPLISCSTT